MKKGIYKRMKQLCIGFIGFGLIGGSIARIRRKQHPDEELIAYNYRKTSNPNLEEALLDGVLSRIETNLETFEKCDIIFLSAPVLTNISYLEKLKSIIRPDCILTDVGSVKGDIQKAVEELGMASQFIGGHPMAGAEKAGYHYSSDSLMHKAYYILSPTKQTPQNMTETLKKMVEEMGAVPVIIESDIHDKAVAAISHIPHITAAALVNLVRSQEQTELMKVLSAGGFKDITRIASSSPEMWQSICLSNKNSILKLLHCLEDSLNDMITMIETENKDSIYQFFANAKEFRDSIPENKSQSYPSLKKLSK